MGKRKKKGNKISKNLIYFIFVIILSGIGFQIGYIGEGVLNEFFTEYIYSIYWVVQIFNVLLMLSIFIVGYLIHIIIHEGGHLLFGLLSGYKFVSFRVGSFIIVREDGKFKSKRYSIPGTIGQCLMMPPEKRDGDFPFILYNLGGALLNLIVSLIAIFMAISMKELSWIKIILILTAGGGLFAAITNGVPLKIGGMANDGHNIMTMMKDRDSKDSFYLQLFVNGHLSNGVRIKNMEYSQFKLKETIDYKNPINFSRVLINHNYHLDNMDFKRAREALEFGEKYRDKTIDIYRMELDSEMLFLELLGDSDREIIEGLYNNKLKKYIEASKFMINKKRIMMAYELLYMKNSKAALERFEELKELISKYPIKGEADMELMLGEYLKEKT